MQILEISMVPELLIECNSSGEYEILGREEVGKSNGFAKILYSR